LSVLTSVYAILSSHDLTIEKMMEHEEETANTLKKDNGGIWSVRNQVCE
jgi:hypothetical protein